MTTINTNYTSTTSVSNRNGISGLVSGINTDEMVESMTSNITAKIAKIKQQQQILTWQQEAYQDIINDIVSFSNKYTSSASSNSLLNSDFLQSATITSKGSNASAIAVNGSLPSIKDLVIQSATRATTASASTSHNITARQITTGTIDLANGRTVSALEGEALTFSYANQKYTVSLSDVKISQTGNASEDARLNAQYAQEALTKALEKAGLGNVVEASVTDEGKLSLKNISDAGNTLKLTGGSAVFADILGTTEEKTIEQGSSLTGSKNITAEGALTKELSFADALKKGQGTMTFDLDGKKAVIDLKKIVGDRTDLTMEELAKGIQDQIDEQYGSGKITVGTDAASGATSGKLTFEVASSTSILSVAGGDSGVLGKNGAMNIDLGAANRLLLNQTLDSSSFNLNGGSLDFTGGKTYGMKINGVEFEIGSNFIKVDGQEKKFDGGVTMNNVINTINDSKAGVNVRYLSTTDRFTITADESGSMGRIQIENMTTNSAGAAVGDFAKLMFGVDASDPNTAINKRGTDAEMSVSFDGGATFENVTRSSNNFSLDGVDISINETFDASASGDKITFEGKSNSESVVKVVKEMVEDYNKLIDKLNNTISTKRNRSYQPLTDAQKKEMSEDEIKNWNEKAKEGLLFGDSMLRSMVSELRFAFSIPVDGTDFSKIGISVSSAYSDNGKLKLDENALKNALEGDPSVVSKLFTSGSQAGSGEVTAKGAMVTLKEVLDKYASTSGSKKGILVQKAGYKESSLSITNSEIYKQLQSYQTQLDTWNDRLKTARDRYYKKFTAMETYLNNWNTQASYLFNQGQ